MKKAIIIGGSSGIGRELAMLLNRSGWRVGVMARRRHLLEELRRQTNSDLRIQELDVADTEPAMVTFKAFIHAMDGVDLVVIAAGRGEINPTLTWQPELETIMTNVTGFAAMVNVAFNHFIEHGEGHLVNISSIAALCGGEDSSAYNASKAFESNYMEGLRQKVRRLRLPITVTDIKPGFVMTAMAKGEGIFWAATARKAAEQIHRAILRKASSAYITRRWRLIAWLLKLMPAALHERM